MKAVVIFAILSVLLIVGKVLRVKLPVLQRLYLPASVIGGIVGLAVLGVFPGVVEPDIVTGMRSIPGFLINVIFATLFLGEAPPKIKSFAGSVMPQLTLAQIVVWGQYAVGIGICGFVLMPLFGVHPAFGNLLEMGFEGGHGTVGGMSQAFLSKNWPDGLALGYTLATIGMICGIGFGMVLINWAYSKGYVNTVQPFSKRSLSERIGIHERDLRPSAGLQTVASDSVDSLAWHIAIVGVSVLIGWGISLLIPLEGFPLFPFCMIGGVVLQTVAKIVKVDLLIDREQIQRISGAALDYLSLAAVATIQLSVVAQNWMPLTVMAVAGLAWTIFAVIFFSPRMFKDAWFERGIAEFGQASGVTATGLLLLRTVDPENKTAAAAAFAGKQLFHEPAMGVWVALAFAFIFTLGWLKVFLISAAMLAIWTMVAALLIWRNKKK
jgi:ESS family glutamate:Na+ symporter